MAEGLALFDLHRGETVAPEVADELARSGLVRVVGKHAYGSLARHSSLRERIDALEAERHELRTQFTWPWHRRKRRERIEETGRRLPELHGEAWELRRYLHAAGLARDRLHDYVKLADGRRATLTVEGTNRLYAWAYSERFDEHIRPEAAVDEAATCMDLYARLLRSWRVAYPPPLLATASAVICDAGEPDRDECLARCVAVFDEWRRRYRDCPADRLLIAALIARACRPGEEPLDAEERAREYQERLRELGFSRERETLWAGALLMVHGFPRDRPRRVYEMWKRLVTVGWSMSSATYPYAARLSVGRGGPTEIVSRVERIFREISERLFRGGRGRAAAASILAQSGLYPQLRRDGARLLEAISPYEHMTDRLLALHDRLPDAGDDEVGADCRPAVAAILARMPGSVDRVWSVFADTLAALREAAGDRVPAAAGGGIDPLTGAALLLCDRAWGGRVSNTVFAFEACAASRNESWDDLTMFRFSSVGGPAWTKSQ